MGVPPEDYGWQGSIWVRCQSLKLISCYEKFGINILFPFFLPVGGKFQSYWPNFVNDTSVIVYAIDSSDPALFDKSKHALLEILSDVKLKGVPLVLLICKQDLKEARPVQEVVKFLGVETLSSDRQIGVAAFQIIANGEVSGLQEAKHLILNFCK